jgi:hypothetical protein
MADVDLPAGTVALPVALPENTSDEEDWRYSAPYDDVVAFLQKQFATGRTYDIKGATWWRNLPPCYNNFHKSPPEGWVLDDSTHWVWADSAMSLDLQVFRPGNRIAPQGEPWIVIFYMPWDNDYICNRS